MRADRILRQNIDAILAARGQTRAQLAAACGLSRSWSSKVWKDAPDPQGKRGIPLKYLDAFADFFGISVYQLFQPGIAHLTERRSGTDRRSVADRRISATPRGLPSTPIRQIAVTPEDEAILATLHDLSYEKYQRVKGWIAVAKLSEGSGRRTRLPAARDVGAPSLPTPTPPPVSHQKRRPPK